MPSQITAESFKRRTTEKISGGIFHVSVTDSELRSVARASAETSVDGNEEKFVETSSIGENSLSNVYSFSHQAV